MHTESHKGLQQMELLSFVLTTSAGIGLDIQSFIIISKKQQSVKIDKKVKLF